MQKKNVITLILAAAGTVLAFLPVAAPIIFGIIGYLVSRRFGFDFLMPFELFPLVLLGSGLLIWAAIRAKLRLKLISWSFVSTLGLIVIGQLVAMASGLASGRIEPEGVWLTILLFIIAAAILSILSICAGGILLLRDLARRN